MQDTSAIIVTMSFLSAWISCFRVFLHDVRGTQVESEIFNELSKLIGWLHGQSPTTIDLFKKNKKTHRIINTVITARKQSWLGDLPIVLLGSQNLPTEECYSPAFVVTIISFLLPRAMAERVINGFQQQKFGNYHRK